jgi:Ca2+-binding EF-hand superfamily protein
MPKILHDLIDLDTNKSNQLHPKKFMQILNRRVKVPHSLATETDLLYEYVFRFRDTETGMIKYKEMAEDLNSFNYFE